MSDSKEKTYSGNCHCGSFKYTAVFPEEITSASVCTCSLCSKKGYLWVTPKPGEVTFTKGNDELAIYQFGNKYLEHKASPFGSIRIRMAQTAASM